MMQSGRRMTTRRSPNGAWFWEPFWLASEGEGNPSLSGFHGFEIHPSDSTPRQICSSHVFPLYSNPIKSSFSSSHVFPCFSRPVETFHISPWQPAMCQAGTVLSSYAARVPQEVREDGKRRPVLGPVPDGSGAEPMAIPFWGG